MKTKINSAVLVVTALCGVLLGLLLEILYQSAKDTFGGIVCVSGYIGVIVTVMGVILLCAVGLRKEAIVRKSKVLALALAAFLLVMFLTPLFEYLYELSVSKTIKASELQYIFLIDDSSSMKYSDRDNERFDAIEQIINNMTPTDRFAVYTFATSLDCITPMGTENSQGYRFENYITAADQTNLLTALDSILDELQSNRKVHTKILLLTDGDPLDNNRSIREKVLDGCLKKNVSISSVGFGDVDPGFLQMMAESTGGSYTFSDDIATVVTNLESIVNAEIKAPKADRNLLDERNDSTYDSFLYGFLRVLFLALIGVVWSLLKMLLIGERNFTKSGEIISMLLCAAAALLLEILISVAHIDSTAARILFTILWSCTIVPKKIQTANIDGTLHSQNNLSGGTSAAKEIHSNGQGVDGFRSNL